ncbi:unnamed protein product, partial [Ascophyllum nodosum]
FSISRKIGPKGRLFEEQDPKIKAGHTGFRSGFNAIISSEGKFTGDALLEASRTTNSKVAVDADGELVGTLDEGLEPCATDQDTTTKREAPAIEHKSVNLRPLVPDGDSAVETGAQEDRETQPGKRRGAELMRGGDERAGQGPDVDTGV